MFPISHVASNVPIATMHNVAGPKSPSQASTSLVLSSHRHHPPLSFLSSSNCSLILRNSSPCCLCVSSSNLACSFLSSLNSSSNCSCHGYSTNTWNDSADVPMTKFVSEKPRVNHMFVRNKKVSLGVWSKRCKLELSGSTSDLNLLVQMCPRVLWSL